MDTEQEISLDIREYWEILRKRWIYIVVIPLVAALASGLISLFVLKPVYEASTTLIVGKKASEVSQNVGQIDYNVLLANQQLAKTYAEIAKSRTIEENVIKDLNLPLTAQQLDGKITVAAVKDTEVLEIKAEDNDPQVAADIANSLYKFFSDSVIEIKKVDSVSVVDQAVAPEDPIKPRKTMNVLIAFAVGLVAAVGLAFLLEYLDNTFRSTQDLEKVLGIPVLGIIPEFQMDEA